MTLPENFFIEDENNIPFNLQKAIKNNYQIQVEACDDIWVDIDPSQLKCGCTYRASSKL